MRFDTHTYFDEVEDESVNGFVIIDTNEQSRRYQIAEKWMAEPDETPITQDTWITYWIPESALIDRLQAGECEKAARLSKRQYNAVVSNVEHTNITTV